MIVAVALAGVVLGGCRKEAESPVNGGPGTEIVFGASTLWQNDVQTRTEYSGRDERDGTIVKTSQYERIDWSDGTDMIRVLCEAASGKSDPSDKSASYVVSGVSTGSEKQKSEAGIEPADGNSLQWGTGSHTFYAMYPAAGMESNYGFTDKTVQSSNAKLESVSGNRAKITGVIPSSQEAYKVGTEYKANMNYAYMYATTTVDAATTQEVVLSFKPLVTAVEVTLKAGDAGAAGMTLKRASLLSDASTGTDLTGGFEATVSSDGTYALSATGTGRRIDIAIAEADRVRLSEEDLLKVTFLALAVEQTSLTLEFTFDKGGEEVQRRIALRTDKDSDGVIGSDEWITVGAGKKIYVSSLGVPGDVWHYEIEDVEDIIINGNKKTAENPKLIGTSAIRTYRTSGSTVEYVPVTYQYSTDGTAFADGLPAGLEYLNMSAGSTAIEKTLTAEATEHEELDEPTQVNEIYDHANLYMKDRTPLGTANSPYDLSMHKLPEDMTGAGAEREHPVTANCYVVGAPGYYRFPMVYGNAIDWTKKQNVDINAAGGGNVAAYTNSNPASANFSDFVRFDGAKITKPSILSDLGLSYSQVEPVVVWQDVAAGLEIVTETPTIQSKSTTWALPMGYICFKVDPTEIIHAGGTEYRVKGAHQGNIVIALRLKTSATIAGTSWPAGTILWSWHIWVTDNPMKPIRVMTNGSSVRAYNDMLPYHLGWTDEIVYNQTNYKTRIWYVKATQTDANEGQAPKSKIFRVIQHGQIELDQIHYSSSTCYHWGRKDPLLGGFNSFTGTSVDGSVPEDYHPVNKPWSSPSGYNIVDMEGYLQKEADMDIATAIRKPHIFNDGGFGLYNLWNANAADELGADRLVVKTVYDPCPPGYSIPHRWAFSNFTTTGTGAIVGYIQLSQTNAADVTGDGELTKEDFTKDNGWHFFTGYGDETIFFHGTCARVSGNSYVRYFKSGYVWTAARHRDVSVSESHPGVQNGGFDLYYVSSGAEAWISGTSHALTVHPVAE